MTIIVIGGENRPHFSELELMGFDEDECKNIIEVATKYGFSPEVLGRALYESNRRIVNTKGSYKIINLKFNLPKPNHYERVMANRRRQMKKIWMKRSLRK